MRKVAPLAFGHVSILHAIADGSRFGFDIMDATGLPPAPSIRRSTSSSRSAT
jgi:hypothetical protein